MRWDYGKYLKEIGYSLLWKDAETILKQVQDKVQRDRFSGSVMIIMKH
jgi:hypothetical protein